MTHDIETCQNKYMSNRDRTLVILYFALTTVFLVQAVVNLNESKYLDAVVYGVLGIANVFVTFHKLNKFRAAAASAKTI